MFKLFTIITIATFPSSIFASSTFACDYFAGVYNSVEDINSDLGRLHKCTSQFIDYLTVIIEEGNLVGFGINPEQRAANSTLSILIRNCYMETGVAFTYLLNVSIARDERIRHIATYNGYDLAISLDPPTRPGWHDYIRSNGSSIHNEIEIPQTERPQIGNYYRSMELTDLYCKSI